MFFASTVLYTWPLVVAALSSRLSFPLLLVVAVIAGYLVLPELPGFDVPLLPALDKNALPILSVLFLLLLSGKARDASDHRGWLPAHPIALTLILLVIVGNFMTTITNREPLFYASTVVPGLSYRDIGQGILTVVISLLPLILGRKLLAHPDQQKLLLVALAVAGCAYTFLALYEIRMSPQLNRMIYGFFPHAWLQHVRSGGFRPLVFLHHGLWLAIFFAMATLAAFATARVSQGNRKLKFLGVGAWILLTLALSNSLGALVITLLLVPVMLILGPRMQLLLATAVAVCVMTYPILRSAGLVPVERVQEIAAGVSEERGASLAYRLRNEDLLLEKGLQKPLFGWGGWGRSDAFDEEGRSITVPDGYWVIAIGKGGWFLYIGQFGLLGMPLILGWLLARRHEYGPETAALAMVLTANLIDLIPNATLTPVTWLIAGSLWGRIEMGRIGVMAEKPEQPQAQAGYVRSRAAAFPAERSSPYTRQTLDQRHRRGGRT